MSKDTLRVLQTTSSIFDNHGLCAAQDFAKEHGISFTDEKNLSEQIAQARDLARS